MNTHINESPFECPDCAQLFLDLALFLEHMQTIHNETIYGLVKKELYSDESFDDAGSNHNNHFDYTSDCSKSEVVAFIQNEAKKMVLKNESPVSKCVECAKEIPSTYDRSKRTQRTCTDCRKSTNAKLSSSKDTLKCKVCEKEYPNLMSLRLHRRIHSGLYLK